MKKINKLLILLAVIFIPTIVSASSDVTISEKNYNKTSHIFHIEGSVTTDYAIIALYDEQEQIAMYVAKAKDSSYAADIKIQFSEEKTITIKVGDINGTKYSLDTLKVEKSINNISKATVTGIKAQTYNGKVQRQTITVILNNKTLVKDKDYQVLYSSLTNAGKVTMTIKGIGNYDGKLTKTFTRNKAKNPLTVKAYNKTVYYSKVKNAAQVVKPIYLSNTKNAGTISYEKLSGSSAKLLLNKTTGKVTVKKGTKKGKYMIKIKVKAAGTTNYKSTYAIRTIYVTVK